MVVDDVFFIRGRGTVLTGSVGAGTVRVGDEVRVGDGPTVRVDGIDAFRKRLEEAQEGQMIGLLLSSLDRSQVNVKFGTNEGMGFVGRGEGIAAMTVVSIEWVG